MNPKSTTYRPTLKDLVITLLILGFIFFQIWFNIRSYQVKIAATVAFATLFIVAWARRKVITKINVDPVAKRVTIETALLYLFLKKTFSFPVLEVNTYYYESLATRAIKFKMFVIEIQTQSFEINPFQEGWDYNDLNKLMTEITNLKDQV